MSDRASQKLTFSAQARSAADAPGPGLIVLLLIHVY